MTKHIFNQYQKIMKAQIKEFIQIAIFTIFALLFFGMIDFYFNS